MDGENKKPMGPEDSGIIAEPEGAKVTPVEEKPKKKYPKAFFVVIAIGVLLALTTAYDRFGHTGKKESVEKTDSDKVVVALAPPPQLQPQPEAATTNAATQAQKNTPLTRQIITDWINSLRKLSNAPPLSANAKLDEAAQAWLSAKLLGGNPEAVILDIQSHNGNKPVHILYSGEIDFNEAAIKEKIEPAKGAKEMVASSLYDDGGIYIHQVMNKCYVVIAMQAKNPLAALKYPQNKTGLPAVPVAACTKPAGGCTATQVPLTNHVAQMPTQTQQSQRQSKQVAKNTRNGVPSPVRPPSLGGPEILDVPPPPGNKPGNIRDQDYDPYPDQQRQDYPK